MFSSWRRRLAEHVDLCLVHLPGRGRRMGEPPFKRLDALVEAIADVITDELQHPFAFYGHSMGAAIATTVAQLLAADPGTPSPFTLIVGGCAPALVCAESSWCLSPDCADEELIDWMRRLGATPPEVLAAPRLLRLFVRLMRADLAVLDSWWRNHETTALPHPLRAVAGRHDAVVPPAEMIAWQAETAAEFSLTVVEGDHFFYSQALRTVLKLIAADLAAVPASG